MTSATEITTRSNLVLDHFYFGFDGADFANILKLVEVMPGSHYNKIQSGADSWEGIYIYAQDGTYLELVKRGRAPDDYNLGIAISPMLSHYTDASGIVREMPWIPWHRGVRHVGQSEQIWFEYFAVETDPAKAPPLDAWIMKYHPIQRHRLMTNRHLALERFRRVAVLMDPSSYESVRRCAEWIPGSHIFGESQTVLKIPGRRQKSIFEVEIQLSSEIVGVHITEIEAALVNDIQIASERLGRFLISQTGSTLHLKCG